MPLKFAGRRGMIYPKADDGGFCPLESLQDSSPEIMSSGHRKVLSGLPRRIKFSTIARWRLVAIFGKYHLSANSESPPPISRTLYTSP
jgi:hypothetical protein